MRKFWAMGIFAAIMAIVTTHANAQRPFPGGGGGRGIAFLIGNKGVQEELKVTEEQKEKLDEKRKSLIEGAFKGGKFKDMSMEDRQKMVKEMEEKAYKEVAEILKPEQLKRLKQIGRQQNALGTLMNDEEVAKELKITDEQKTKFKTISEETTKEIEKMREGAGKGNFREILEKVSALQKENSQKAVAALSDDQKKTWKELVGSPFEVKVEGFRFPKKTDN